MERTPKELSLAVLEMAQAGRFTQICELFATPLRALVTAEALHQAWTAELQRRGPISAVGTPVTDAAAAGCFTVRVPVRCEHGAMTVIVATDSSGSLVGIQVAPETAASPISPWQPPSYADPDNFDEHDVTLGSGPLAVPGTLALPRQPGPLPATVLLGGSGPLDRDETIGRNKPLKDLAWGLASHGIAVVRFDKVTYVHPTEVKADKRFTLTDEYVHYALAALHLLREHPSVDAERILLCGHSLGGTVAPRIAAQHTSIAGLVILAGGAQPLHWSILRQVRYLASLRPGGAVAADPMVKTLTEQAQLIDGTELSPSTPSSDLPFGTPASYWLDLRSYDPVAAAALLGAPLLVLQGGRDYQVTVQDDFERWKDGLRLHHDVTFRTYPDDNHLFFPGSGPSSPAEYEPTQHMDPAVAVDIADWIATINPRGTSRTSRA